METDFAPVGGRVGSGELANGGNNGGELFVVRADAGIEFGELGGDGLVVYDELAEADEGADYVNAHVGGGLTIEDVGRLDGTMFCEGIGEKTWIPVFLGTGRILRPVPCTPGTGRILRPQTRELGGFFGGELKHEIFGKFAGIAFELLVEPLRGHAVEGGEIGVDEHPLAPQYEDAGLDVFGWNDFGFAHRVILKSQTARSE